MGLNSATPLSVREPLNSAANGGAFEEPVLPVEFVRSLIRAASICGICVDSAVDHVFGPLEMDKRIPLSKTALFAEKLLAEAGFDTFLPLFKEMDFEPWPEVLVVTAAAPNRAEAVWALMDVGPFRHIGIDMHHKRCDDFDYFCIDICNSLSPREKQFLVEMVLAVESRSSSIYTAHSSIKQAVEIDYKPKNTDEYQLFFPCPVTFNGEANRLVLTKGSIDKPLKSHSPKLYYDSLDRLKNKTERLKSSQNFEFQIALIIEKLADQVVKGWLGSKEDDTSEVEDRVDINIKSIAAELNQSSRSLQRKLSEHNECFTNIKYKTLVTYSKHLLLYQNIEIDEIAYLLGFGDRRSFSKVFQKHIGVSPAKYKQNG